MKNFMFLYEGGDPKWHENTSPEDMAAQMGKWEQWMADLSQKGKLIAGGDPLHYSGIRLDAKGVATDIAASEFKDLVSGYSVVAAQTAEEAIEIAKTCPIFFDENIKVQIREVVDMGDDNH